MSRFLHCYFDGLNARPPGFPAMKIQYVRHYDEKIQCPYAVYEQELPLRQRVVVRLIFRSATVRSYAMPFLRDGGTVINATTYEMDLYFLNGEKAMKFLQWKEQQTEKAWAAFDKEVSAEDFAFAEGIGQFESEKDISED